MKKKSTAVIGMVVCLMMMAAGAAWSAGIPGVPNGTVTDGNLVWLQNANCFGKQNWNDAMSSAASLKSGMCGLTDGSTAGQWRLPTKEELQKRQGNRSGFNNVQSYYYWSSSSYYANGTTDNDNGTPYAWCVYMYDGNVSKGYKNYRNYVWPVRAGQ